MRLSRGRRRRAGPLGAAPGPCARCPDDAARRARPPGPRPGPRPVARGAGGGARARLRPVRAPLPLRPGARRPLPRQLLGPRPADARARAAHPRGRHRTVSTGAPTRAARLPWRQAGAGRARGLGEAGRAGSRPGGRAGRERVSARLPVGEAGAPGLSQGGARAQWVGRLNEEPWDRGRLPAGLARARARRKSPVFFAKATQCLVGLRGRAAGAACGSVRGRAVDAWTLMRD